MTATPAAASPPAPQAHASGPCDRYAAPNGSRRGRGTRAHPYGSLGRLVRGLRRGQVGCLMAGRYRHRGVVAMRRAGTTLRPLGSARVTIDGAVWALPGARGARITGLRLTSHDRIYPIPLKIQADDFSLVGNDITAARNISCVLIGSPDIEVAHTVVERNRVHDCGSRGKLAHLIYVTNSRGAVIRANLLVDNQGGWAVHLYPNADGTLVERNVIDSNEGGVIFAGDGNVASDRQRRSRERDHQLRAALEHRRLLERRPGGPGERRPAQLLVQLRAGNALGDRVPERVRAVGQRRREEPGLREPGGRRLPHTARFEMRVGR